jgi:hypothetical protein
MANRRAKVLKDMGLQSHGQKPPRLHRHRQMILALDKVYHPNGQMPDAVRSKCLTLWAELFRSVIFKTKPSEGRSDER